MTINVVYSCDDNYLEHFCVSLYSLLEAESSCVKCHLLFSGSPSSDKLVKVLGEFGNMISVYFPEESDFENAKTDSNIPVAAYFRLLLADYFGDIDRVVYLDCDTVITRSIEELFKLDMRGNVIAAVADPGVGESVKNKLGVSAYFNSGVMLVDIKRFGLYKSEMFNFLMQHERITFHDQCVLNYVLRDSWLALPDFWNYMSNNFKSGGSTLFDFAVLHYNSIYGKPWELNCTHPLKCMYLYVRSRTIFSGEPLRRGRLVVSLRNRYKWIDSILKLIRGYDK
ncbi:glycosyltransferase family 8 protein [Thalassolituus sp. LLYu03]|uniref:glycosyltransferase family 8 protein n=1 Tax=Thalassolituus sp. LLYu03 TaxID=3421656 RepID=UPI003D2AB7F8